MTDLKMLAIGLLAGLAITLPYIVYLIFAQERLNTQLDELLADIPNVCDGKEQYAFLAWKSAAYHLRNGIDPVLNPVSMALLAEKE